MADSAWLNLVLGRVDCEPEIQADMIISQDVYSTDTYIFKYINVHCSFKLHYTKQRM